MGTREVVVRAAVETILEEGFYRASSNRIAQRAGLTWGVIQHHFGTRENLLLAVVRDSVERLVDSLSGATIAGDTTAARLDSLADVIWSQYRAPEFVAYMQTVLNLSQDPRTAARTLEALVEVEEPVRKAWRDLMREAVPGADRRLVTSVFEVLRGVAIGEVLLHTFPHSRPFAGIDRRFVVDALAAAVDVRVGGRR